MLKTFVLFTVILLALTSSSAQPQYTIDITNQLYQLKEGFLKMGTNISPGGEKLSYTNMYLTKNGKPWFPIMGEMHYSQCAEKDWEESIIKMKCCGVEVLAVYIFWIHHEETEDVYDWSGNRNLRKFLSLCKKHGMYVWLRPGPWIHAEARNGGFPDWLMQKNIPLRQNDSTYLGYVKKWFKAVAGQCKGYFYKQNGTIIGVQIENEMEFKDAKVYAHMKTLKQLAIEVGMDVPYYSAFAQGPDDQDEFLYTMGGYPDSPWATHTKKMYKPVYFIKPLEADPDIGSDLFGQVDKKVRNTYPKLSAELGSGMQKTYHRRVDLSATDIGANVVTRIGSGLNGLGYFMFHGGLNPVGKTTMTESRATGYPNDMPYINYDFQAPVGAMDIIAKSYNELRMINLFVQDFGEQLATEKAFFPKQMVATHDSYDTVQASVRVHNNSGFIFLSNYQRFVDLPVVKNFQLHLTNAGQTENIPEKPVLFPTNSYAIWPYHMQLGNALLQYATAQPLCTLKNIDETAFVFFADGQSEFVFNKENIAEIKCLQGSWLQKTDGQLKVGCDTKTDVIFTVISTDNKKTTVIVLPRGKALQATKIKTARKELLVFGRDNVLYEGNKLVLEHIDENPATNLLVYPSALLQPNAGTFKVSPSKTASPFAAFTISANKKAKASVSTQENKTALSDPAAAKDAASYQDSILRHYASSKQFNKSQPGPLYQYKFHNLPGQRLYSLSFDASPKALVKDWILDIDYQGDVMALYRKDTLIYDQFNYNDHCLYRFSSARSSPSQKLQLQVLPMKKGYDIYVEDKMLTEKNSQWLDAQLKDISLKPVYLYQINIR